MAGRSFPAFHGCDRKVRFGRVWDFCSTEQTTQILAPTGIRREQELARLFYVSGWTQEELAGKEGVHRSLIGYRLVFGRFLDFATGVASTKNLPEKRFRGFYRQTESGVGERKRFIQVIKLIEEGARYGGDRLRHAGRRRPCDNWGVRCPDYAVPTFNPTRDLSTGKMAEPLGFARRAFTFEHMLASPPFVFCVSEAIMSSRAREPARGFYSFADLVRCGYVRDRTDLSKKIRFEGFPRPVKAKDSMQARADYLREAVHAWERARIDAAERPQEQSTAA